MKTTARRFATPPSSLRRSRGRFENLALVPASELTNLVHWQRQAERLTRGSMLLVVPPENAHLRVVGERIHRHQSGGPLRIVVATSG